MGDVRKMKTRVPIHDIGERVRNYVDLNTAMGAIATAGLAGISGTAYYHDYIAEGLFFGIATIMALYPTIIMSQTVRDRAHDKLQESQRSGGDHHA